MQVYFLLLLQKFCSCKRLFLILFYSLAKVIATGLRTWCSIMINHPYRTCQQENSRQIVSISPKNLKSWFTPNILPAVWQESQHNHFYNEFYASVTGLTQSRWNV